MSCPDTLHPICGECWDARHPNEAPETNITTDAKRCEFCDRYTRAGIVEKAPEREVMAHERLRQMTERTEADPENDRRFMRWNLQLLVVCDSQEDVAEVQASLSQFSQEFVRVHAGRQASMLTSGPTMALALPPRGETNGDGT